MNESNSSSEAQPGKVVSSETANIEIGESLAPSINAPKQSSYQSMKWQLEKYPAGSFDSFLVRRPR